MKKLKICCKTCKLTESCELLEVQKLKFQNKPNFAEFHNSLQDFKLADKSKYGCNYEARRGKKC